MFSLKSGRVRLFVPIALLFLAVGSFAWKGNTVLGSLKDTIFQQGQNDAVFISDSDTNEKTPTDGYEPPSNFASNQPYVATTLFNNIFVGDIPSNSFVPNVGPVTGGIDPALNGMFRAAMPFVPTASGTARIVSVWTQCVSNGNSCLGAGDATIEFQGDNNGQPNGVTLGSTSFSSPVSTGGSPGCSAVVGNPVLTAGTRYWAVMSSNQWAVWLKQPGTPVVTNKFSKNNGPWTNDTVANLSLRVEDDPTCSARAQANPVPPNPVGDIIVAPGQSNADTVTIQSVGTASLVITGASFTGGNPAPFTLLQTPTSPPELIQPYSFPKIIGFGATTFLYVACTGPSTEGIYSSTLNVTTNDPTQPTMSWPVRCIVDSTPPTISFNATPDGTNGWFKTKPALIGVNTTDLPAGGLVKNITCTLNGSPLLNVSAGATTANVNVEGTNTLSCTAIDLANNVGGPTTLTVKVDSVAPSIAGSVSPPPTAQGWNSTDVSVGFSCSDAAPSSGLATNSIVTPVPVVGETTGSTVSSSGSCVDSAGNSAAQGTVLVKIDKTAPVITSAISPLPNAAGWNNSDVTVNFSCADTGPVQSGVLSNTLTNGSVTANTPFAGTSVSNGGTCTDAAANSALQASALVKLDKTPPTASIGSGPPAFTGNRNASFTFNGADTLSGLSSFECSLDNAAFAPCSSPEAYLNLSIGNHDFRVRSIDAAGNTGPPANYAWAIFAPPTVSKFFVNPLQGNSNNTTLNGTARLAIAITNPPGNPGNLTGLAITDTFPAGLEVDSPVVTSNTCGGTFAPTAGATSFTFSGGGPLTVANQCTIFVVVKATQAGAIVNTTGNVSSTEGGTGLTASGTLNVFAPPVIAKSFTPPFTTPGGDSTLTFTITNPAGNPGPLTGVSFTDNFPAGILVASTPALSVNNCGGTVTGATSGSNTVSLSGASVIVGTPCTISVDVTATTGGLNSVQVSSTNGGTGNTATATLSTCVAPPPNMRGWYTGDGTLRDIAGGYDASSGGTPATTYAAGKVGQAFDFNGTTQNVGRTDTTGMDTNASAFSFDAWIRREGNLNGTSHEGLITKMTTTSSNLDSFASFIYNNATPANTADDNFYIVINGASTFNTAPGTVPALNTWFHYAQTYDGTNIRVYVNGNQIGIFAFSGRSVSTGQLFIGGRGLVPSGIVQHPFNGQIDEVEVFNAVLSPASITSIFSADGGGKCKPFDLRIDKEDVNAPFDQGVAESYTIVVTNDGPATTSGTTTVTDTFPAGITPGAATGTNWSCNTIAQLVTCTSTDVVTAGNVFPTITVPLTVAQNAPASVSNTATVATSPTTGELDTSDNSDTEATAVTGFALTPSVTNGSTLEDTQTANGQLVITPNALDGSEVTHYKITNIANGTLFQNNGTTPIAAGSFITAAQGVAGLRFTPALNFFGNGSFDVTASTSASDAGLGGAPATATIVVTPVNDAPTLNDPADMNINEDAGLQTVNLLGITSGVINEAGQTLAVTATSDTPGLIPNPTVVYTSPNASATLTFTPVANVSGVAIVTVTVTDNGGTANGGVNTFSQTFTVTVAAVNDAPTLNDPSDMTILEDAALQTVNLSGITAGPNETQVLTVTATSDTPGLIPNPTVTYTSANTTGSLTFTPVANQSGSAIVTVTVTDNGGTANGGVNTFSQTFTVNVTAVNDAPTLNDPADVTILEDAAPQTVNLSGITAGPLESQTLVVTAISSNPGLVPNPTVTYTSANTTGSLAFTPVANQSGSAVITVTVTDNGGTANGGVNTFSQTLTVKVTPVNDAPTLNDPADATILEDAALQTVNLSGITAGPFETQVLTVTASSNNTGLIPNPTVTYTSANTTGTLIFTPVANANGSAIITVTVTDDGGIANGGVNTFSQTFTVNVTAVNDPPTFTAGPNVTRVVNQGPQTVNPWATGITNGPPDESGQTLTGFTVTGNSNPGLFAAAPAISTAGVLTFTSTTGATGTATVTLTLSDNGGTANGGSDTSAPQTFTITIDPGTTTTALASSLNPSPLGAPVTFTATVTPNAPSGGVPQGTVEFRDNNVAIGTGTLNGEGVATFTTSSLTSGPHPITAVYLGSSAFNGSTSPVVIQVVDLPPTAAGTAPTVVTGGGTAHTVTVTYTDDFAINVASLDSNDIRVTGPNAFNSAVTFTGVNINTNGTPRVATYTFNAPGGSWDIGDNGTYSIVMQANQVVDSANQPVATGPIGTFVLDIPPVTISGNIKQYVAGGPNTNLAGVVVTLTSNNVPVPGPATTNANGDYVITNVSHGANVVITPSGLGKVYDPLTRTFNNVTTNATANFIAYDPNAIPRTITVVDTYAVPGAANAVPIVMNSQGTETFVSFSLNYSINPLASDPTAACGAATAPGCTVTFNNATPGQIGVTITNPVAFAAGAAEIAVINFNTLANSLSNTPLTFGDAPVVRLVRDASDNHLPATYINGSIVFAQGREGDIANRNTGNGAFESADVVQMRRFVAGLDTPAGTHNEFQRADTAPASTKGDGTLNSTDLVQTRRYVAGLDTTQSAGGAGIASSGPIAPPVAERSIDTAAAEMIVGKASGSTESRVSVPVGMRSNGDEVAVNFVIRYDATRLGNAAVQLVNAADGATLTANTDEPGVIRVLVDSSGSFARSNAIETLVNISFDIASTAPTGDTPILIEETTISDALATSLAVKATNGLISIAGPNAVVVEIAGRVLAPNGSGLRNATVILTDPNGVTRTATTATFGYYRFEGLAQGKSYSVKVSSRRFRFTEQRITPSDNLSGVDFTGQD